MSKIIPFVPKNKSVVSLIDLAQEYDQINRKFLKKGENLTDIAGIMANRLGELLRVYQGDKELLLQTSIKILKDKSNMK